MLGRGRLIVLAALAIAQLQPGCAGVPGSIVKVRLAAVHSTINRSWSAMMMPCLPAANPLPVSCGLQQGSVCRALWVPCCSRGCVGMVQPRGATRVPAAGR